jgi:Right handed beta helix region
MKREATRLPVAVPRHAVARPSLKTLSNWARFGMLAMCSIALPGCELVPPPSPITGVTQEPAAPVLSGGQSVPVPSSVQMLTGCTNPNSGSSNGDWGVGSDPVYVDPDSTVVGSPIYARNAVFWISRETAPGQSVLLSGAFTDASKIARIAFIPSGTTDWHSLVLKSATIVPTIQQSSTGLSFIIPSGFPAGVYGFAIQDASAPTILGLVNVPSLSWAIGVPSVTDAARALEHEVYDCGVEPGGNLRLFGKNFVPSDRIVVQSSSGIAYELAPSELDSNSITASVPSLVPGIYNVWVGNLPWSATSSPAGQITVYAPSPLAVRDFACSDLVGDGATDNTKRLQSCLDRYAPLAGANEIAHITVSAGTFVLSSGVAPHPFEVLLGSSSAATKFVGRPPGMPPSAWFTAPQYFGMANLSLQAPANPNLLTSSDVMTGSPRTSGHLFFSDVKFASTSDASNGGERMFILAGPDIQVYNSFFLSNSNQDFDIIFGDGVVVSGNQMVLNNWTGLGIEDSQNIVFADNVTYSQNPVGRGANGHSGGSGLAIGRAFNQFGPSAVSQDVYVGYNTFHDMGSRDQQVITNDGGGGSYYGHVASSTANTVTLADDPAWNWMGTTNPQASNMAIISGTGVGQHSFLQGYSGRTIKLMTPWAVLPDATSVVVIAQYDLNMTFAHNTISNTLGESIVLSDALEGVIEDNVLTNSGQGILISAFGPYGGPAAFGPVMNTDVLRNTISKGTGTLLFPSANTNIAGIGILDMPGCLLSGLMIRDNAVTSANTIFSTNGLNGISANVIEQNRAYWEPTFAIPGFLIQDNSPPPSGLSTPSELQSLAYQR